jgi:hypothetical protein
MSPGPLRSRSGRSRTTRLEKLNGRSGRGDREEVARREISRFAPQDPGALADPAKGIRQFVIGTGGAALYRFGPPKPNSEVRGAGSFGIAKFVLDVGKYSWEFLPASGSTFTDRGEANCVQ